MSQIFTINLWKILAISATSLLIASYFYFKEGKLIFLYASFSLLSVMIMDMLISPFIIYSSALFLQKNITKLSSLRWCLNCIGLLTLYFFPNLLTVAIKDIFIFILVLFLWKKYIQKTLKLQVSFQKIDWQFIKKNFIGYSLWLHLIGCISNIIYKADALILYYFVSLQVVGNYNIALTLANAVSMLPSTLIYQNNIALSHCQANDEAKIITGKFLRWSIYVGILSFIAFIILGKPLLSIFSKESISELYFYLLCIAGSILIIKGFISPFVSYINIKGDVRRLFIFVQIPLLIIVVLTYTVSAFFWGARGCALSNVVNGIIWIILIAIEMRKYDFKFSDIGSFKKDYLSMVTYVKKISLLRR